MNSFPGNHHQIFLRPGELLFCGEPSIVTTLLGSCVAVTMFSPARKIGAICHALLPQPGRNEPGRNGAPDGYHYVSLAIPAMLDKFRLYKIRGSELEIKLFGGASVLGPRLDENLETSIGALNVRLAKRLLAEANLRILRSHVGGGTGRKLLFNTDTGEVLLKHLSHHVHPKN